MPVPYTWIYLIRDIDTDYYKIGKSDDPARRLAELIKQATLQSTPNNYELLAAWLCPESKERELHKRFKDIGLHIRGEWFDLRGLFRTSLSDTERAVRWMSMELHGSAVWRWGSVDSIIVETIGYYEDRIRGLQEEINQFKETDSIN